VISLLLPPRLVAELHADSLSSWEPSPWARSPKGQRPVEGACISEKLEQAIKANRRGLGYGG
jgi:hypothetical protein